MSISIILKKKPVDLLRLFSLTLSVRYGWNWKFTIAKLQIDSSQPVSNVKKRRL